MKTEKDFVAEDKRIDAFGGYFSDPCVALEDAQPFEGQDCYWTMAIVCLHNGAAHRILEAGLNPKDFGLEY